MFAFVLIVVVLVTAMGLSALTSPNASYGIPAVTISLSPSIPLIAPGQTQNYASIVFHSASNFTGEMVMQVQAKQGMTFLPNQTSFSLTGGSTSIPAVMEAAPSAIPGSYPVTVVVRSNGTLIANSTLEIKVVSALIVMHALAFNPQNITVAKGTTVWWINLDSTIGCCDPGYHTVSLSGIGVLSPTLRRLDIWSYQFDTAGAFSYYCTIHIYMKGEIVVTG